MNAHVLQASVWPVKEEDLSGIKEALLDIGVEAHKVTLTEVTPHAVILGVVVLQEDDEYPHEELEIQLRERLKRREVKVHSSWTRVSGLSDEDFGPEIPL